MSSDRRDLSFVVARAMLAKVLESYVLVKLPATVTASDGISYRIETVYTPHEEGQQ